MSQIISFSVDKPFADSLESLIQKSGYQNRSKFLRDAALHFADLQQRGDLSKMDDEEVIEGHLIIHYQHGIEHKIMEVRHSNALDIKSYNHSCLPQSHMCVDVLHSIGNATQFRSIISQLQNTPNVDKVTLVRTPVRESGCC
ncbi:MAG: ribbon-helix-helix protein, CopG family [Candidatus Poseidoniaceae archaeon]|jgi:metal-responsive CopG/Arc/MetJ family transcriptional regulator|nr:ribbon-helix-helix protein, CopG family [Candidatus Poseidoniaceae archaeon]